MSLTVEAIETVGTELRSISLPDLPSGQGAVGRACTCGTGLPVVTALPHRVWTFRSTRVQLQIPVHISHSKPPRSVTQAE